MAAVCTVTLSVDGGTTTTTRALLPGVSAAWPVPGGHAYVEVTPATVGPADHVQASISRGNGSNFAQGDHVVLGPAGVLSLADPPGLTQLIELQVTAGTVTVGATGAAIAPPARLILAPSATVTVIAGAGGAELARVFRLMG
jgi:hypothetical protein